MDLDEMKSLWGEMSEKVEQQQLLNDKMILEMTELKYSNTINQILKSEIVAMIINLAAGVYILFNFGKLDTIFLQFSGVYLIFAFIIVSPFSVRKVKQMKDINLANNDFKKTISLFHEKKKELFYIQNSAFFLVIPVIILGLPVYMKMVFNTHLDIDMTYWLLYISGMLLFMFLIWVIVMRSYKKLTKSAEDILKELED